MYLVRSVLASELSDKDIRSGLLSHFDKPMVLNAADTTQLIDLCESGFERDVYTALTTRGYRVLPQVKTGAYRIDMVVEGAGDVRLSRAAAAVRRQRIQRQRQRHQRRHGTLDREFGGPADHEGDGTDTNDQWHQTQSQNLS